MTIRSYLRLSPAGKLKLNGPMPKFALIGAFGTLANVAIMTILMGSGVEYLLAAAVATETTILSNFLMQERLVFADRIPHSRSRTTRFVHSFGFNNAETLVRMPFLWLLVDKVGIFGPLAQFGTLAAAFTLRYMFHSRVVYAAATTASDQTTPHLRPDQDIPINNHPATSPS